MNGRRNGGPLLRPSVRQQHATRAASRKAAWRSRAAGPPGMLVPTNANLEFDRSARPCCHSNRRIGYFSPESRHAAWFGLRSAARSARSTEPRSPNPQAKGIRATSHADAARHTRGRQTLPEPRDVPPRSPCRRLVSGCPARAPSMHRAESWPVFPRGSLRARRAPRHLRTAPGARWQRTRTIGHRA